MKRPEGKGPVVGIEDLWFYRGDKLILEAISLSINEGIFIGLIGPNGGGKTTLLRLILGLHWHQRGEIHVFGTSPSRLGKRRSLIGYLPQQHNIETNFPATVLDVVLMGAYSTLGPMKPINKELKERGRELLELVGLGELWRRPIGKLSGGQQQRALIARALIARPRLLLLDEPIAGVDTAGQRQFIELILRLKEGFGLTVLMVSHDVGLLAFFADTIACLNIHLHWHDRSELLNEEVLKEVYACELDAFIQRQAERKHLGAP
ncbi:MAG: metal ABC transporter ATP-binding protein [Nitrospinota bacterium]